MKKVYLFILIMVIFIISGCSNEANTVNISQKEKVQVVQKKADDNYSHGIKLVESEQKEISQKAYTNEATKYAQLENQLQKIMQETNPEGDDTLK